MAKRTATELAHVRVEQVDLEGTHRDRVDVLGGNMALSSPPSGTALLVELPIWRDG